MDNQSVEQFEIHRPLMFSIAYRMLGSIAEAEDIVQEAYLRYQAAAREPIVSHKAFLSTVVTRLCLNHLELARVRREAYIGPWLPEPALTALDQRFIPAERAELHESLSIAFLVLLEQLTPAERAVFLLREVFDYDYHEIAAIVGKEPAACRKLFSRAKKHIAEHRPRFQPTADAHRQLLAQFIQAAGNGDLGGLLQLLADEVTLWADGGGKARGAATQALSGRDAVARFLVATTRLPTPGARSTVAEVNGEPALIVEWEGQARVIVTITAERGQISAIRVVGNPDKLHAVNQALGYAGEGQALS